VEERRESLVGLAVRAYAFPAVMAMIAIVPGCNIMYSGHGGPAWIVLPFVFPVALTQLIRAYRRAGGADRGRVGRFIVLSLACYAAITFEVSLLGVESIRRTFGLPVEPFFLWGLFFFPFNLVALL
jgi:hypothetical protein